MPTREIKDSVPLALAWQEYKRTAAYTHALEHAKDTINPEGLLWGQFETGWAYGAAHARREKSNG